MKILLIGDYSGVHSDLARTLKMNGHSVTLVSNGDGYKNYERDIDISEGQSRNFIIKLIRVVFDILGIKGMVLYFKYRRDINRLSGYDVVQLINTIPLPAFGSIINTYVIYKLLKRNKSVYLCALGDDYAWVSKNIRKEFKYSALDRLNISNCYKYTYSLRYAYGLFFKANHSYVVKNVKKIIPGLMDYDLVYNDVLNRADIIKIPLSSKIINTAVKLLQSSSYISNNGKIKIFHGWQKGKDLRKGNDLLHQACLNLVDKYGVDNVEYNIVSNVPYSEYIEMYNDCDIFIDQVYSYDRGVNALLGMASGKVVVSGFEDRESIRGNIKDIGINATPDLELIIDDLEYIILNKDMMNEIKSNALRYVIDNHDTNIVTDKYLTEWTR